MKSDRMRCVYFLIRVAVLAVRKYFQSTSKTAEPPPEGFSEQLEWVKKLTAALGYFSFDMTGLEADDLIASAVRQKKASGAKLVIVSADKDPRSTCGLACFSITSSPDS